MRLLLACLVVAACSEPVAAPTLPSNPREVEEPAVDEAAVDEAAVDEPGDPELAWTWRGPPLGAEYLSEPAPSLVDPGGLTCRFARDGEVSRVECVETRSGRRRWGLDVRDGTSAAALLRDGETLYTARYERTGFGVIVERLHLDRGERRWRRALPGLPIPIGGLPVNAIELALEGEVLVVRGWDVGGRWAVALDPASGAVARSRVFEGRDEPAPPPPAAPTLATDIAWQWEGPPLAETLRVATPEAEVRLRGGGRCRWRAERLGTREGDRSTLECLDRRGARVFGFDDAAWFASMTGRAMVVDATTLYVLAFHRAASGATMTAYELATGVERWSQHLRGLGPITHSGYLAFAQLRMIDGRPVAFGWEASGRYIEVLDPATGATVWHRIVE